MSTKDIETRIVTASHFASVKVAEYLSKGFILNPTMGGSQGEILKVDLTNDEITYRIVVLMRYEGLEDKVYCRVIKFESGFDAFNSNILWNVRGHIVIDQEF